MWLYLADLQEMRFVGAEVYKTQSRTFSVASPPINTEAMPLNVEPDAWFPSPGQGSACMNSTCISEPWILALQVYSPRGVEFKIIVILFQYSREAFYFKYGAHCEHEILSNQVGADNACWSLRPCITISSVFTPNSSPEPDCIRTSARLFLITTVTC